MEVETMALVGELDRDWETKTEFISPSKVLKFSTCLLTQLRISAGIFLVGIRNPLSLFKSFSI